MLGYHISATEPRDDRAARISHGPRLQIGIAPLPGGAVGSVGFRF
jgi:hypothetical protein